MRPAETGGPASGADPEPALAQKVFETAFEAVMIIDRDRVVHHVNPAFERVTGFSSPEVVGRPSRLLDPWRHDDQFRDAMCTQVLHEGSWSGELWIRRRDGNVVPIKAHVSGLFDAAGHLTHYVINFMDLSEYKDAQTLLDYLAYHDAITGLPNRLVAHHHFERCARGAGESGRSVAVMCVNVDRLPVIHHSLGRQFVDEVLRRLAEAISSTLDETGQVSRQSGDQVLVIGEVKDRAAAALLAERICAAIARELVIDQRRVTLSGRIGIALFPEHGSNLDDLARFADNALHGAPEGKGNGWLFYSKEIEARALARVELEAYLRHAIPNHEMFLVYQPKVAAANGVVRGAEALLRWHSPKLGVIPPSNFIPLAEETGLILEIDSWVVREACRQVAAWKKQGLTPPPVSVNLSAQQFHQANLVALVQEALHDFRLPGEALDLEITEGALIHDVQRATEVLGQLRALGVSISLDDFGTGYSSLSYLKSLPIDTLKLDKSFVDAIPGSPSDEAIALTVLALARHLGLAVVAEGVESFRQFEYLRGHGCDQIQGYVASRPLTAEMFERLLGQEEPLVPATEAV